MDFDTQSQDYSLIVKRYFFEGYSVKTDVDLKIGYQVSLSSVSWNIYLNDSRQYGMKLEINDKQIIDAVGGANVEEAALSFKLNLYDVENVGAVSVNATQKGKNLLVEGNADFEEGSFDFSWSDNGTEASDIIDNVKE